MKTTSKQLSQDDPLEELKLAWERRQEQVQNLPFLTDERLDCLYKDFSASHDAVPPLTGRCRRPLAWTQVLLAVLCLCVSVCSVVLCVRLGDDLPVRVMLCAIAVVSLLLVVYSLNPRIAPLYRRYCFERDGDRSPLVGFGLGHVAPIGMVCMVVLVLAVRVPIGDGFHILTVGGGSRQAVINSVGFLMTHML